MSDYNLKDLNDLIVMKQSEPEKYEQWLHGLKEVIKDLQKVMEEAIEK